MRDDSWGELAIAAVALLVLAIAATIEATAVVISRHRLRRVAESQGRTRTVQSLLDPRRTLSASLLMVQAAAIAIAAGFLTTVILREFGTAEHALAVVLVVIAYMVFGRALPLAIAAQRPDRAASVLVRIADALSALVWPLTAVSEALGRLLVRLFPGPPAESTATDVEDDLRSITVETDDGVIEADEREMIDGILHLEAISVRDIMVPRVDIVAVNVGATPDEIVSTITKAGHSRIPVYEESIDRILGILYAKDLLPFVVGSPDNMPPVRDLLRPVYIVPESKRVDDLLKELRRNRIHIAIVADEYGGIAGMLTIEDILEEIVGEIHDEYDTAQPLFEVLEGGILLADGRLPIEDVEDALGLTFTDDDYGTVGGFVQLHLGRLPRTGDRFSAEGVDVEVIGVEGTRVRGVRLARRSSRAADDLDTAGGRQPTVTPPDDDASASHSRAETEPE